MSTIPLAELGPEDAVSFLDTPAAKVNVVNAPGVRELMNEVWETIRRVKSRRSDLENEWLAVQRMGALIHDEGQKYLGRSNAYLPVYARARKTLVSVLSRGLFPSDEYLDVVDRENGESEQAKAVKETVRYEFETSARIRARMKPFLGQFVDFGFAVLKRWYRTDRLVKPKRIKQALNNLSALMGEVYYDEGFTISARSPFNVVVYPEWAEDKCDLQIEAERLEVPVSYVNSMHRNKRWENVEEALSGGGVDSFDWLNQQSLSDVSKIPGSIEWRTSDNKTAGSVIIVEAWFKMIFPRAQYAPDEDPELPVSARAVFVNGVPVLCRRNNFYDQYSPFEYARDNIVSGNFYGSGAGRLGRYLQYLANDFANQTNDCGIYGLNPIALVNTNYFSGPFKALRPGGTYQVRDVEQAIKFERPSVEIVQYGQTLLNQIVLMAQDGMGAPQILQGTKAASTATGSQLQMQGAQSPLQDTVEDIEAQVMVPLMRAAWALAQQYRTKPLIRSMNGEAVSILPSDINIDADFRFLASSQANSRSARQQGLMAFSQLLAPMLPLLQMQGKTVDPTEILRRAWSDGLGNRNFDKLIVPMAAPPMPGALPQQPGTPTPPTPPTEQPPPVEQGNIMPTGEGMPMPEMPGGFNDVRGSTDDMNAMVPM